MHAHCESRALSGGIARTTVSRPPFLERAVDCDRARGLPNRDDRGRLRCHGGRIVTATARPGRLATRSQRAKGRPRDAPSWSEEGRHITPLQARFQSFRPARSGRRSAGLYCRTDRLTMALEVLNDQAAKRARAGRRRRTARPRVRASRSDPSCVNHASSSQLSGAGSNSSSGSSFNTALG